MPGNTKNVARAIRPTGAASWPSLHVNDDRQNNGHYQGQDELPADQSIGEIGPQDREYARERGTAITTANQATDSIHRFRSAARIAAAADRMTAKAVMNRVARAG